jgi:EmrB/QacA subfamily drug resistance transporter
VPDLSVPAATVTPFPEGPPRNRAFAVYAAMSGAGAAVGLIAGGLLTDYLSWRWVFFVNIPIGVFIAAVAPRVLGESEPIHGRIDWLGAVTGTAGLTLLVYAITRTGTAGWSDAFTIGCFALSALILAVFVLIETKHEHPIMPLRLFRNRNRSGTYVVMLVVGAGLFASFYFLSLFVQGVLGYSAVQAGLSFLPFTVGIVLGAGVASQLTPRLAPRVLVCVGLLMGTVGLLLNAQLDTSSSYLTGLLPPMIITSIGMGLVFVPLTLTAVSGVDHHESGIASALFNTVQQVGGSLGLAALATIAATATNNMFPGVERLIEQQQQRPTPTGPPTPEQLTVVAQVQDALTHGYTRAFLIGAVMMVVGLIVTAVLINAPRQEVRDGRAVPAG